MNWQHLQAFLWLRWRLLANQWRRGGAINGILMIVIVWCALISIVPLFLGALALGIFAIPYAEPVHLLYAWDGVIVAFLFFWGIGLITELQRTETLSLANFLHLPVSIKEAFLINYASSLLRLSLIVFVPVMLGFALAMAAVKGPLLLSVVPLVLAFLLMVTGLTYQFQGWLASLMSNPRRRRAVVVAATGIFVVAFQLPNLINVAAPWRVQADQSNKLVQDLAELKTGFDAGEFDAQEHVRRQNILIQNHQAATEQASRENARQWETTTRWINLLLPIGWLPLGVTAATEGSVWPAVLGCFGMTLLGAGSLWRAYYTTLRLYQGEFTASSGCSRAAVNQDRPTVAIEMRARKPGTLLVEARLPGLSEPVAAIALGGFRSLVRAPEAKMMLLTPILLAAFFGWGALRRADEIEPPFRPLLAIGAMAMVHFGVVQLMANQFAFDRDGFRVFVLCAASRRDVLFGKNLSFLPLALGMAAIMLAILQVFCPMRWDHLVATLGQFLSMFLLFCLLANLLSIFAPMPIAAGSMKPANPKLVAILLQMSMFMCLFPLTQLPALMPVLIELGIEQMGWTSGMPISLVLSSLECAAVIAIYRVALRWEGKLLESREQRILEIITNRAA